jgi:hypothetical protein
MYLRRKKNNFSRILFYNKMNAVTGASSLDDVIAYFTRYPNNRAEAYELFRQITPEDIYRSHETMLRHMSIAEYLINRRYINQGIRSPFSEYVVASRIRW